jgi:hypothetical protein
MFLRSARGDTKINKPEVKKSRDTITLNTWETDKMSWSNPQQLGTIYSTDARVPFKLFNDDVWHPPLYFSPGRRQAEIIGFIYLFRQQACSRSQYLFFLPKRWRR